MDSSGVKYINQLIINSENGDISGIQEKCFPYQNYEQNKYCQKVVKIKPSDKHSNNINLFGNLRI